MKLVPSRKGGNLLDDIRYIDNVNASILSVVLSLAASMCITRSGRRVIDIGRGVRNTAQPLGKGCVASGIAE